MIRVWLAFFILAALIHFGITAWRKLEGKEQWALTKSIAYSIIVASLAGAVMALIVILF
jgi:hypothetical protein